MNPSTKMQDVEISSMNSSMNQYMTSMNQISPEFDDSPTSNNTIVVGGQTLTTKTMVFGSLFLVVVSAILTIVFLSAESTVQDTPSTNNVKESSSSDSVPDETD